MTVLAERGPAPGRRWMVRLRRVLSRWAPASVIALVAAFWVRAFDWPPTARYWLIWPEMLLVALAWSADRRGERKPSLLGMPLDRVLLWAVFGLVLVGDILDGLAVTLLVTGAFGFMLAVEMIDRIPARHKAVFDRLADRGVLDMTAASRELRFAQLKEQARKWATAGGPIVAVIVLAAWIVAREIFSIPIARAEVQLGWSGSLPLILFSFMCSWIAGERLGRMIAYGTSWQLFVRGDAQWRIMPGHPDRVGGFKPIGDFFFYESIIAVIPAIFLAAWSVVIWVTPSTYQIWRNVYPALLAVTITLEVVGFFLPMRSIHALMRKQKTALLAKADQLYREIDRLQHRLCEPELTSERQQIKDSIADLAEASKRIEKVPTWPIDPSIRRRFSIAHAALLLPFIELALKYWL